MEALQKMSDPKLVECPQCHQPSLRKQVTAARFKLKGTGWYETDFKNSGKKPEAKKSDTGSSESTGSSTDNKTSSSTEAKSADTKSSNANGANAKSSGANA